MTSSAVLRQSEAQQIWLSSDVYTVTVPGEATGGALSITDAWIPPGGGPPRHLHAEAIEVIFVQAGMVTVEIGTERQSAREGDAAVIPAGTIHRFWNETAAPAHLQFIFTPSGTERFFLEAGMPVIAGVPTPLATEEDNRRAAAIGLRYGLHPGNDARDEGRTA